MRVKIKLFQHTALLLLAVLMSSCGGSDSTGADGQSGGGVDSGGGNSDTGDETSDDLPSTQSGNFNGVWYGVLIPQGGLNDTNFSDSLIYEVSLQQQVEGYYTGTARVIADRTAGNLDFTTFNVRAEVEGKRIDISPVSTNETSRNSDTDGSSATCRPAVNISVVDGDLEGTWEAETGQCGAGVIVLERLPEPLDNWHEPLPSCNCEFSDDIIGTREPDKNDRMGTWVTGSRPGGILNTGMLDLTTYHPGGVFDIRWVPDIGEDVLSGQQCIYDSDRRLITGGLGAGTPDLVSPGNVFTNTLGNRPLGLIAQHNWADVSPFEGDDPNSAISCTEYLQQWPPNNGKSSDGQSCPSNVVSPIVGDENWSCARVAQLYTEGESFIPPIDGDSTDEASQLIPRPASYTDPHLVTIDGLGYSFQAVGEFVLARSALPGLEIQARQAQYGGPNSPVSVNSGFAFNVNGDSVSVVPSPAGVLTIYVDDEPQSPAGEFDLPEGGRVVTESATIQILWPDGSIVVITDRSRFLNLALALNDRHAGQVSGLLGNFDTNTQNDLLTSEGRDITTTPEANELYGEFADGWRVTDDTSLFTYFDGATTATFTNRLLPGQVVSADTLDGTVRENAAMTCRDAGITNDTLLQNCIVDIGVSGDTEFATALNAIQQEMDSDIEPVVVLGEISVPTLACDDQLIVPDFNAQYSGTFTNPDAGLVWNSVLQLGQCGNDVVGLMTIETNDRFQNRRLLGTLDQGQITLSAGFPVAYDGLTPCRDMQITLVGASTGLAGFWTASNCPQGGEINLPDMTHTGSLSQAEIDQLTGTWTGPVDQPGSSTEYSAVLTFTETVEGSLEGVTDYPELACDTTLVFLGEEGGYLTFRETVVTNITACVNQGTVSVRLDSSDTLEWLYRMPGATDVAARAQLSRQ